VGGDASALGGESSRTGEPGLTVEVRPRARDNRPADEA
jgi:hypothetical protein